MSSAQDPCALLLLKIQRGDVAAFSQLYHDYSNALLLVLLHRHQQRSAAEAALRELFIRVWTQCHSFHPDQGDARAWLFNLAPGPRTQDCPRARAAPGVPELPVQDLPRIPPAG